MKDPYLVPVVIVTWNSSEVIANALACLENQILKPVKVVVVDNASDDLDKLIEIVDRYPFCELKSLDKNYGFAKANNIALAGLGEFELVALLNPDAYPKENWLSNLVEISYGYPQCGSFASKQLKIGEKFVDGTGDGLTFYGRPFRIGHGKSVSEKYSRSKFVFSACAAAALYRRSALEKVNCFDESFFCYVEDIDLGYRLQLCGYQCLYVSSAEVVHKGGGSSPDNMGAAFYYGQRNLIKCFLQNSPVIFLLLFIIPHLFMLIISLVIDALKGRFKISLSAKLAAFYDINELLAHRASAQNLKSVSSFSLMRKLSLWKY